MTSTGYGQERVSTKPAIWKQAHVAAWERVNGPVPAGLVIDHQCHNLDPDCDGGGPRGCEHRRCVNPDHLRAVPQSVNILAGKAPTAVNAEKTHCIRGHEFTPENTYSSPTRKERQCRACQAIRRAMAGIAPRQELTWITDPVSGCWNTQGTTTRYSVRKCPRTGRARTAHALAWEAANGPVPDGYRVAHSCASTRCVNPSHLLVVPAGEAGKVSGRSVSAINGMKIHCDAGHPFDLANTYIAPKTGARHCRACARRRGQEYQRRKQAVSQ